MTNTMGTIIFQISDVTRIIRLLIRVIKVNFNCLSDLYEMFHTKQLKDDENNGFLKISYAILIIRLLVRVISDLKVNYNYLSDLDEMFCTKQLKDD